MSPIDGASRSQPPRPVSTPATQRAAPTDVSAMRTAIEAARSKVDKLAGQLDKTGGQAGRKMPSAATAGANPHDAAAATSREEGAAMMRLKSRQEGADALGGWAGQGPGIAPAAITMNPPAPQVDAGAFAQMLADLWTRENGRGAKEIRVRFGDRSWPATGAVLIRNAAGTLDVALQVGDNGKAYGDSLPGLEDALHEAGVAVGSLRIENDA